MENVKITNVTIIIIMSMQRLLGTFFIRYEFMLESPMTANPGVRIFIMFESVKYIAEVLYENTSIIKYRKI